MAQPGPSSSTGAGQGARAAPETPWITFIHNFYPRLLIETHFLPPYHFNRTPHAVETIAGQTVLVRDNPNPRRRPHQPPVPQQVWEEGRAFVENSLHSRDVHVPDSDQQDDRAVQLCRTALSEIHQQVMMVITGLQFQKYLNPHLKPLHATAIAQLPTIQDPSLPQHIQDGECDFVIIHRQYGVLIGELKSIGGGSYFPHKPCSHQTQMLIPKLEKALKQLQNQETALRHLLSDLPPVTIKKIVMLPNITSCQLQKALDSDASLLQTLCQVLSSPQDVTEAVGRCLCKDNLQQPRDWWQGLNKACPGPIMDDYLYTRIIARFCGPATTVDVPTAGSTRKELRFLGQAVAETGLRFSSLALTPAQVTLLSRQPEPRYTYLQGPPGTGKTICLFLKALQWVQQGRRVVVVSGGRESRAVSLLLQEQLKREAGPAAANIDRHCCDLDARGVDAEAEVRRLQQQLHPGQTCLIVDEFSLDSGDSYIQWLTEVRARLPDITVWMAGIWTENTAPTPPLPPWVEVQTLQESLRCPPTVTAVLQQSFYIQNNFTLPYTAPQHPVATQGPPVQEMQHKGQPGHSGDDPWRCDRCADDVIDILTNQLRVGQPDHGLQYRDVFILCAGDVPRAGDVMVQRLQGLHGLPVRVTSDPPSEDDTRELALAVSDVIMVADSDDVQGLERRVVIALSSGEGVRFGYFLPALSRCSAALYCID